MPRVLSVRNIAAAAALLLALGAGAAMAQEEHRGGGQEHHPAAAQHPAGPRPGPAFHAPPGTHPGAARAAAFGRVGPGHVDFRAFHGDPRHWDARHFALWRGGSWHHDCRFGRCGWWWFADGEWYWYSAPVYPYPLVVSTIVAADVAAADMAPPPPAPYPVAPPMPPTPTTYWYCASSGAYYPAVPACAVPWQPVPGR